MLNKACRRSKPSNKGMKLTKPGGGKSGVGALQLIPGVGRTHVQRTDGHGRIANGSAGTDYWLQTTGKAWPARAGQAGTTVSLRIDGHELLAEGG